MMTRDEACATWCPMVRIARHEMVQTGMASQDNHIVGGCNTDAIGRNRVPASCMCIADKCAMWRWGETKREQKMGTEEYREKQLNGVVENRWREVMRNIDTPHRGYCGLAGVAMALDALPVGTP